MRVLVTCFVLAFAAGFSFRSNHWESLILIDSTDYGKRLLDTIQIELQSQGNVDNILKILNELKDDLINQQNIANGLHDEKVQECTVTIEDYTQTINSLALRIEELEKSIPEISSKLDIVKSKLSTKEKEISELNEELESYDSDYKQDKEDYEKRVKDHRDALQAVDAALEYLEGLKGSQAGEGRPETSEKIAGEEAAEAYNSANLIQLGADQATIDKLISKLTSIKGNLSASIDDENTRHEQAESDYNTTRGKIVVTLSDLTSAKDNLIIEKGALETELNIAEQELASKKIQKSQTEDLKAKKEKECEDAEITYNNNKKKRSEEVSTVDAIVEILKNKSLGEVDKYIENRQDIK